MSRPAFILCLLLSASAEAAVITVTTTADENDNNGQCSLREAVIAANNAVTPPTGCAAGTGATVDVIMVPAGTYNLTLSGAGENSAATGDLDLTDSVVIDGAGQATTIIDAQALTDRVFHVITNNTTITFRNVTISGGHAPSASPPNASGGGIFNDTVGAKLILDRVLLTNNTAGDSTVSSGGFGGGLYSGGAVLIMDSTVSNNTAGGYTCNGLGGAAGYGGGVLFGSGRIVRSSFTGNAGGALTVVSGFCDASKGGAILSSGSTVIEDSHFQNNSAADGGVYYGGALTMRRSSAAANTVTNAGAVLYLSSGSNIVENSTFSGNQSDANKAAIEYVAGTELRINQSTIAANRGGGLHQVNASTHSIRGSFIAGNETMAGAPFDCFGVAATSLGNNLLGANGGCVVDIFQQDATVVDLATAVDPQLSTATNGTRYHAPVASGPIVDRGVCQNHAGALVTTDQRGLARTCACDIGAVELQRPSVIVSDETPGLSCPAGGKRIDTLDCAGAIIDTSFVCTPTVTVGPTGATGPAGVAGATGATGAPGANGADGMNGTNGTNGADGMNGINGTNGADGMNGINGTNGTNGTNGVDGVNGAPGVTGPTGNAGRAGSLVQTETIAAGDSECAEGGLLLRVGTDADGDETLAAAEVRETHKLCTPARATRGGCASSEPSSLGVLALVLLLLCRRRAPRS